ncbi:hypothetical protein LY78DRAFT_475697 [Colletotrichum sublineola]|nr:hypothetical protein LY78DRAFT_475697 [Colletotrichum sublineola]
MRHAQTVAEVDVGGGRNRCSKSAETAGGRRGQASSRPSPLSHWAKGYLLLLLPLLLLHHHHHHLGCIHDPCRAIKGRRSGRVAVQRQRQQQHFADGAQIPEVRTRTPE